MGYKIYTGSFRDYSRPMWVEGIPILKEFWENPIFQYRYVFKQSKAGLTILLFFCSALIYSALVNLFLAFGIDDTDSVITAFYASFVVPFSIVFFIKPAIYMLIIIPNGLKKEVLSEALDPVLTTPLSDREIFFAHCCSGFMRSLGKIENTLAIGAGLLTPWLIIFLAKALFSTGVIPVLFFLNLLSLAIVIFAFQLIFLILLSLSAGFLSVFFPAFSATISAAIFTVSAFSVCSGLSFCALWILSPIIEFLRYFSGIDFYPVTFTAAYFFTLQFVIRYTVKFGADAFSNARRPGLYSYRKLTSAKLAEAKPKRAGHESNSRWFSYR
ncbi:MAG: hypothetical protein ABIC40_06385 [bacterium]